MNRLGPELSRVRSEFNQAYSELSHAQSELNQRMAQMGDDLRESRRDIQTEMSEGLVFVRRIQPDQAGFDRNRVRGNEEAPWHSGRARLLTRTEIQSAPA
jgi:hypothetical protein